MRTIFSIALTLLLSALSAFPQATAPGARPAPPPPYTCDPVNPEATPEARALLKNLCAISGRYILSGQHNFPAHLSEHSEKLANFAGKYPAVWGSDFGFTGGDDKDSVTHRQEMIDEAKKQAAQGSIIVLCWHMLRPTEDEPGTPGASWRGSVQARLTDEQWAELITPDTPLHKRWEKYMDTAADYLKQLQDAHIPVLFRPMHENNGDFLLVGRPSGHGRHRGTLPPGLRPHGLCPSPGQPDLGVEPERPRADR